MANKYLSYAGLQKFLNKITGRFVRRLAISYTTTDLTGKPATPTVTAKDGNGNTVDLETLADGVYKATARDGAIANITTEALHGATLTINTGTNGSMPPIQIRKYRLLIEGGQNALLLTGTSYPNRLGDDGITWSYSSINVASQSDLDAIDERVGDIEGAYVTGVKGNSESSYRKGNVNITPANIGLGNLANLRQVTLTESQTIQAIKTWYRNTLMPQSVRMPFSTAENIGNGTAFQTSGWYKIGDLTMASSYHFASPMLLLINKSYGSGRPESYVFALGRTSTASNTLSCTINQLSGTYSNSHLITKIGIKHTYGSTCDLYVYYAGSSTANYIHFMSIGAFNIQQPALDTSVSDSDMAVTFATYNGVATNGQLSGTSGVSINGGDFYFRTGAGKSASNPPASGERGITYYATTSYDYLRIFKAAESNKSIGVQLNVGGSSDMGYDASVAGLQVVCSASGTGCVYIKPTLALQGSGTYTGSWAKSSDERLKENFEAIDKEKAGKFIDSVRTVNFNFLGQDSNEIGVIAQDVQDYFPEAVVENTDGFLAVDYSSLVTPLIVAVRDLREQVRELRNEIAELKNDGEKDQTTEP